jgi:hypothetical protein
MRLLQLTPLAKARVWFHRATPAFIPVGTVSKRAVANPIILVKAGHITLEALVPRGGRAEYGLLGITFQRDRTNVLQVEVPYSDEEGTPWLDSIGNQVDHVLLGLPREYAGPIVDAAMEFGAHQFPAGIIKVVEAAHGLVGSNADFFRRLVTGALTLMSDDRRREDNEMTALLQALLIDR